MERLVTVQKVFRIQSQLSRELQLSCQVRSQAKAGDRLGKQGHEGC